MLRRLFPSLADAATAPLRRGPLAHRPIAKRDVEHLRWAGQGGWVMPGDNPGIRVEPAFISEAEGSQIAAELDAAASAYGYPYDGEARVHLVSAGSGEIEASLDGVVNNLRVTGRLERPDRGRKSKNSIEGDPSKQVYSAGNRPAHTQREYPEPLAASQVKIFSH